MADNKFGLSDALINAVRQVAENSAPLPRDERERDLARQARMKPKSLDEASSPKKKPSGGFGAAFKDNLKKDPALAAGFAVGSAAGSVVKNLAKKIAGKVLGKEEFEVGNTSDVYFYEKRLSRKQKTELDKNNNDEIDPEDLRMLRKKKESVHEETDGKHPHKMTYIKLHREGGPEGSAEIHHATINTPEPIQSGDSAPRINYLIGKSPEHEALKEKGYQIYKTGEHHTLPGKNYYGKPVKYTGKMDVAKEETEHLDEALTAAQRREFNARRSGLKQEMTPAEAKAAKAAAAKKRATAAARRLKLSPEGRKKKAEQQANSPKKPQAYVSPETDETGEKESEKRETHIVMAARKAVNLGEYPFTFEDGKTHIIDKNTARRIIATHSQQKDKGEFEERLRGSHKDMMGALKNPDNAPPKPKGREARLAPKTMPDYKTFAGDLARVSRGGPARER